MEIVYNKYDITHYLDTYKHEKFKDQQLENIICNQDSDYQYIDKDFPPNDKSLGQKILNKKKLKNTKWIKVTKVINQNQLQVFNRKLPQKVIQGRIGDCYLLNPVSILSLNGLRYVERLFTFKEYNQYGYYSVWLNIDGQWTYIQVDDNFPWRSEDQTFQFCWNNGQQIWPMIIEKAWAKLHTQYSSLWGGNTGSSFRVLTGAPVQYYPISKKYSKDPRNKHVLYNIIKDSVIKKYLISMSTGELNEFYRKRWTQGHSYALQDISLENHTITIRDPRGEYSPFKTENVQISFDELIYLFTGMFICKVEKNFVFSYYNFKEENLQYEKTSNNQYLFRVDLNTEKDKIEFYLSFFQSSKRFLRSYQQYKNYKLSNIEIQVFKINFENNQENKENENNQTEKIKDVLVLNKKKGCFKATDMFFKQKNDIYFSVKCQWKHEFHKQFNIQCYGENYVQFEQLNKEKSETYLFQIENILQKKKNENLIKQKIEKQKQKNEKIQRIQRNQFKSLTQAQNIFEKNNKNTKNQQIYNKNEENFDKNTQNTQEFGENLSEQQSGQSSQDNSENEDNSQSENSENDSDSDLSENDNNKKIDLKNKYENFKFQRKNKFKSNTQNNEKNDKSNSVNIKNNIKKREFSVSLDKKINIQSKKQNQDRKNRISSYQSNQISEKLQKQQQIWQRLSNPVGNQQKKEQIQQQILIENQRKFQIQQNQNQIILQQKQMPYNNFQEQEKIPLQRHLQNKQILRNQRTGRQSNPVILQNLQLEKGFNQFQNLKYTQQIQQQKFSDFQKQNNKDIGFIINNNNNINYKQNEIKILPKIDNE